MRGASALEDALAKVPRVPLSVFVIWEPVLGTDFAPPTTAVLGLVADVRTSQFWDPDHLVSSAIRASRGDASTHPVWDWVAIVPPGARWDGAFPNPAFSGGDVVSVIDQVQRRLSAIPGG